MSTWDTYNANVKAATPDWMKTTGNVIGGATRGATIGSFLPVIGTAVGGVLGAVGSGLNALFQNKEAKRQNARMAEVFEYQKEQDRLNRQERQRQTNIGTMALMRENVREALYGRLSGRF